MLGSRQRGDEERLEDGDGERDMEEKNMVDFPTLYSPPAHFLMRVQNGSAPQTQSSPNVPVSMLRESMYILLINNVNTCVILVDDNDDVHSVY